MKRLHLFTTILILVFINTSCSYFKRSSDTKVIYIVKPNTLNVRQYTNAQSKILGKVHKGDTIVPFKSYLYWVGFEFKGQKGFLNVEYLKGVQIPDLTRVSNMQLGKKETLIRDNLNKYVNWRTGRFWVISLGFIVVLIVLMKIGKAIDAAVFRDGAEDEYGNLPYFSAFIGALFSLVYIFWHETVLQALFVTKLWPLPGGEGWIPWYLWSVSVLGILGLLFFWKQYLSSYGARGIIRIIYYTFTASVSFVAGIFWGIVGVIFGIVYLFLSLSEDFSSGGGVGFGHTSFSTRKLSESEQFSKDFWERKYNDEWKGRG